MKIEAKQRLQANDQPQYDHSGFPLNYAAAKEFRKKLSDESRVWSEKLNSYPKEGMGMTPDHIKQSPEWKEAYSNFNKAFERERKFNGYFTKQYKKEYAQDRANRYAPKV